MRPLVALSAALLASAVAGTARVAGASPKRERVVVLDDGAQGLTPTIRTALAEGWPDGKVLFSRVHPDLGGKLIRFRRYRRRDK